MRISPHLTFDGQCKAAFAMYQRVLGGKIHTMLSYGESPMAQQIDPQWHSRIIHATLVLDDGELTGVDLLPGAFHKPAGFFVTLTLDSKAQAERIFQAFAIGGEVQFPFQSTFWSPGFGVLVDPFGIPWELNTNGTVPPA